jgi:hypothetical protein
MKPFSSQTTTERTNRRQAQDFMLALKRGGLLLWQKYKGKYIRDCWAGNCSVKWASRRHAVENKGEEIGEGSRDIWVEAGDCPKRVYFVSWYGQFALTCVAPRRTQVNGYVMEVSYDLSESRWHVPMTYLDRRHLPCSYCWDESQSNRLRDDAIHVSEFGGGDGGVMLLELVPQVDIVLHFGWLAHMF